MALDMDKLREKASKARYTEGEARYLRENVGDAAALDLLRRNEEEFGPAPTVDTNDEAAVSARVMELKAVIEGAVKELNALDVPVRVTVGEAEEAEEDEEDEDPGYDEWSVADLDTELKKRTLPTTGNKSEKVDRLYTDDERKVAEAEAAARQS